MSEKGLTEAEKRKLKERYNFSCIVCADDLFFDINTLLNSARLQTLEDVWKCFCNRGTCKYHRPAPDMGGKDCMLKHGDLRNESGIPSVENCPLIKSLKEAL
jgi:hypothetical protein